MWLIPICIIAAICVVRRTKEWKTASSGNRKALLMASVVLGLFIGLLIFSIIGLILPAKMRIAEYERSQLIALTNAAETEGSIFLLSGSLNGQNYYRFYQKLPDGGVKFGKIPAENAVVYEEDRNDGYLAKVGKFESYSEGVRRWFFMNVFDASAGSFSHYSLHVPKGTIKRGFKLEP